MTPTTYGSFSPGDLVVPKQITKMWKTEISHLAALKFFGKNRDHWANTVIVYESKCYPLCSIFLVTDCFLTGDDRGEHWVIETVCPDGAILVFSENYFELFKEAAP